MPCGMRRPRDGGPGTRDGPAWVGFAGCPASPVEEKRGIPRPRRSVIRQHALRKVFPPLAQDLAGGVQAMGCSISHGSLEIAPLGATSGLACAGAEPAPPLRDRLHARYARPGAVEQPCTAALPAEAMRQVSASSRGCWTTFLSPQRGFPPAPWPHKESLFRGVAKICGVRAVFLRVAR